MKAYELLARLKHLTLTGYEDGQYLWIGTNKQWYNVESETNKIIQ